MTTTKADPRATMARLVEEHPPMSLEEAESGGWKLCGIGRLRCEYRRDPQMVEGFRLTLDTFQAIYTGISQMGVVEYANKDLRPCFLPKEG